MRFDLFSAVGVAIMGALLAFFVCNLFLTDLEDVTFTTVTSKVSSDIAEPNEYVFNFRALDPTLEVYVGDCAEKDQYGNCLGSNGNGEESEAEDDKDDEGNEDDENSDENEDDDDENEDNVLEDF